jgi:hypothetical protein
LRLCVTGRLPAAVIPRTGATRVEDALANDYRIEKERLTVVLTMASGERLAGDLFVQSSPRNRYGREDACDIANSAEPYFPLLADGGGTVLVSKDNVRDIAMSADADTEGAWDFGDPTTIEVTVLGGVVHTGVIHVDAVNGRSRVLDFLNRLHDRFLLLRRAEGGMLVNRRFIERVRDLG